MAATAQAPPAASSGGTRHPSRRLTARRVLGSVGRLLVTSGVVLLLLVAYQLWGTNLQTARAQDQLQHEFEEALADRGVVAGTTTVPGSTTTTPADRPDAVHRAAHPPSGRRGGGQAQHPVDRRAELLLRRGHRHRPAQAGAAHYPESPLPGQAGNAAIAGHRTTWGAPFHNIDKMQVGDIVEIETQQGTFRYEMTEQLIVAPQDTYVLDDVGDNRLTLTACHPKLSSKQRIVIHAALVGNPVERLPGQDDAAGPSDSEPVRRAAIDEFESEPIARFPGRGGASPASPPGPSPGPHGLGAAPPPPAGAGGPVPRGHTGLPLPAVPVLRVGQLRSGEPRPAPLNGRRSPTGAGDRGPVRACGRRRPAPPR